MKGEFKGLGLRAAVVGPIFSDVTDGSDFRENLGALGPPECQAAAVSDSGSQASDAGGTGSLYRLAAWPGAGQKRGRTPPGAQNI